MNSAYGLDDHDHENYRVMSLDVGFGTPLVCVRLIALRRRSKACPFEVFQA